MTEIRQFRNGDLPALARVWVEHWSAVTQPPYVSVAVIEQAIMSRSFFDISTLTVADHEGSVHGWSHFSADPNAPKTALIGVVCFTSDGLQSCDALLRATEAKAIECGFQTIVVGPLRDNKFGYSGLEPLGHGIGVSATDSRTASLLSRNGFSTQRGSVRMLANTNPYRMPVSRDALQLRRKTRVEQETWIPTDPRQASAMCHMDIERYRLVNHLSGDLLATAQLWFSDPEAQVMSCSNAILDLGESHERGSLDPAECFLIGSVIQSLASRRVFSVETAVDTQQSELIEQLSKLQFQNVEQGQRWEKIVG